MKDTITKLVDIVKGKMGGKYCSYCGVPRPHPHAGCHGDECEAVLIGNLEDELKAQAVEAGSAVKGDEMDINTEEEIVSEIKNLKSKLNEQIGLAATYYGIEASVSDMDVTTAGDKAKKNVLSIKLFKVL